MSTKGVLITMTADDQKNARQISKEILGKENISGLFRYFINQYKKNRRN